MGRRYGTVEVVLPRNKREKIRDVNVNSNRLPRWVLDETVW